MDQIANLLDRPKLYYNIDGVGELAMGFMALGYSLLGWLQLRTPADSPWHQMYVFIIYVGLMLAVLHFGPKAVKKHITYPRTGFVAYRKSDRWRMALISVPVSMLIPVALVAMIRAHWETTPAVLFGLLLAAAYAYRAARSVPWKWAVASVMAFGSLGIALLPPNLLERLANQPGPTAGSGDRLMTAFYLCVTFYGVVSLLSGAVSFRLYLRHTRPPAQDAQ